MKIKNEDTKIHSHTGTSSHSVNDQFWKELSEKTFEEFSTYFTDIWYYAQVFICEVCSKKTFNFEIDFIVHLNTVKHQESVSKLRGCHMSEKFLLYRQPKSTDYSTSYSYIKKYRHHYQKNGEDEDFDDPKEYFAIKKMNIIGQMKPTDENSDSKRANVL